MKNEMLGWELLLQTAKPEIVKKEHVMLLLVHYSLLRAGFKCAGNNEDWNTNSESLSELLPEQWNAAKEFTLRYKYNDDKYLLISHTDDNVIIFNLTFTEKLKVTNVIFNFNEAVKSLEGDIGTMIPTYKDLLQQIEQQLISPFNLVQNNDKETQTTATSSSNKSDDFKSTLPGFRQLYPDNSRDLRSLQSIGRRDLDPLAAMGGVGGMLFDPFSENRSRLLEGFRGSGIPQSLPRGSIPPHARFDPFGPPDPDMPNRRPPDYDDMFA